MAATLWGKKIGMTQLFSQDKVVPVTAIDLGRWVVTQVKTADLDGYDAVKIGCVKERFNPEEFKIDWLKKPNMYFQIQREVEVEELPEGLSIGSLLPWDLAIGSKVDVAGFTKGHGFQGVVKRHGFSGAPASHGGRFGRRPGSIGFIRTQGKVIKGKRLPGHMGNKRRMAQGLEVVKIDKEANIALVKGSVPGKAGSFLFIRT